MKHLPIMMTTSLSTGNVIAVSAIIVGVVLVESAMRKGYKIRFKNGKKFISLEPSI